MNRSPARTLQGAFLLSGVLLSGCLRTSMDGAFVVKEGHAHADIVIATRPPRAVKLAAVELQEYLHKISGARLPIVTAPATNACAHLYVGRSADTDRLGINDDGLPSGAFRAVSGRNWLALIGHDANFVLPEWAPRSHADWPRALKEWDALTGETWGLPVGGLYRRYSPAVGMWDYDRRGSLNAVYAFLYDLGVRWYMPGEWGEIVPRRATIPLPAIDTTVRPDFAYRNLGDYSPHFDGASREAVLWRFRIGLDPSPDAMGLFNWAHALNHVHGRDEVKKAHPEYFALYGGKRATEGLYYAPCLSSPGLFAATVKYARTVLDLFPDEPAVCLMPNDGYVTACQCELCKGRDTPERGNEGKLSDYVWDFVNRVAVELHKTHPDRKVVNVAYGPYRLPPERIATFSPNVMVGIVQGRVGFGTPEVRDRMLAIRKAYLEKLAPGNFLTTDHYLYSRPGGDTEGMPVFFPHAIAEDLRSLKGVSRGEYIELSQGRNDLHAPGFNHLNVYVTARYYWNAGQDIGPMLDEYYSLYYGPAAKEMRAFIEYSEIHWPAMRTTLPILDRALALLAAARQAAGDTVYGRRIDLIAGYVRPLHDLRQRLAMDRKDIPRARIFDANAGDIALDGRLDDPCWTNGAYGWQTYARGLSELETGRNPFSATSFRLVWADKSLWIGIHCEDRAMRDLNVTATTPDDANLLNGDAVMVLIETQGHSYYAIAVNPAGAVYDADLKCGTNTPWSSGAEVAVHRGDTFWSVEMRLPAGDVIEGGADVSTCMEGRRPSQLYPWYFNVCRQRVRPRETERLAFSPTGTNDFHAPLMFGELSDRW